MDPGTHNKIVSFIWGISDDVLHDLFKRGKYPDVILPICVIRRMDVVLEPTKQKVLETKKVPAAAGAFHAQYRRATTGEQNPYTILDGIKGLGRYVGTFLAWTQMEKGWFGEGEIKFYMDGDDRFPTICGTGTEDYFLASYGFP